MDNNSLWESLKYTFGLCAAPIMYFVAQKYKTNNERLANIEERQIDSDKKLAIADLKFSDIIEDIKDIKAGMNKLLDWHFSTKNKKS